MTEHQPDNKSIPRRAFVQRGSLFMLGAGIAGSVSSVAFAKEKRKLRLGLITDLHYADKPPAGTRHYRETIGKLQEAGKQFAKDRPDALVELGDFIDAADSVDVEQKYLRRIHKDFVQLPGKKYYVLGNHCVDTLTKAEFLGGVGQDKSYFSFDLSGFHFVILDSCFRSDGVAYQRKNFEWTDANIPAKELDWLAADLKATKHPTIVFAHQRLDVKSNHGVKNAAQVRSVLEKSGRVIAVFQGHSHQNEHREISGIHYCVIAAMVEGTGPDNNGYATLDLFEDASLVINGFRRQQNYRWS